MEDKNFKCEKTITDFNELMELANKILKYVESTSTNRWEVSINIKGIK